jgi:UDP-N-acetylmuramate dehydrogenase
MLLNLPTIRGKYLFDFNLKNISFLKVGGKCDVLFLPQDESDLVHFLKNKPKDLKITILGNLSNTLILDGGIRGCVIILKNTFSDINFFDKKAKVGGGITLEKFIEKCLKKGLSSCEKLTCIPGTIGGAIAMNAGVPDFEISDVLLAVNALSLSGEPIILEKNDLKMTYRNGNIPKDLIITSAILKITAKPKIELDELIKTIRKDRKNSQPIGQRTCGSTFKNPPGMKAWKLIKEAECDKLNIGGAKVSDVHCNFLINVGNATASDFVALIKTIKNKVFEKTGVTLEEEIITLGENL